MRVQRTLGDFHVGRLVDVQAVVLGLGRAGILLVFGCVRPVALVFRQIQHRRLVCRRSVLRASLFVALDLILLELLLPQSIARETGWDKTKDCFVVDAQEEENRARMFLPLEILHEALVRCTACLP